MLTVIDFLVHNGFKMFLVAFTSLLSTRIFMGVGVNLVLLLLIYSCKCSVNEDKNPRGSLPVLEKSQKS